jgi:mannose-6-phosphate isomerase-like protein (cupin superfamily)
MHTSTENWGSWETHPSGEELVLVLSGRAEFIQLIDGVERRVVVGPHEAIINPAGVAHTANVIEPFAALYITPAPGTSHRPRE